MKLEINPSVSYQEPWQSRWGYPLLRIFLGLLIRWVFVKKIRGLENIPPNGPVILVPNHESFLDFFALSAAVKRRIHYLSSERVFVNSLWRWLMNSTGQVRIDREAPDKGDLFSVVVSLLAQGKVFCIFPEGKRSRTGEMLPAYTGVAKFAVGSGAPIIPIGIKKTFEVWPRHEKWPKIKKEVEIIVGEPMNFSRYGSQVQGEPVYRQITDEIMQKIAGLTGKEYLHAGKEAY